MRVVENILELVGQTPMLRMRRLEQTNGTGCAEIWAKLEFLNPGGSIKDRAALGLVLDAERRGVLQAGGTIVEATAGNTGVGLALIGVNRGYKVMLYVPVGFAE
jgi:cysteine synthase